VQLQIPPDEAADLFRAILKLETTSGGVVICKQRTVYPKRHADNDTKFRAARSSPHETVDSVEMRSRKLTRNVAAILAQYLEISPKWAWLGSETPDTFKNFTPPVISIETSNFVNKLAARSIKPCDACDYPPSWRGQSHVTHINILGPRPCIWSR